MLPTPPPRKLRLVIFLGTLLAFQAAGWYFFWGTLTVEAKISAERTFSSPQSPLQHLTISAHDLARQWVGKREIRWEGRLYDVLRQRPQGDSVRLEVYHDQREEALFRTLHSLLAAKQPTTTPLRSWLLHWVGGVYLLPLLPVLPQPPKSYVAVHFRYQLLAAQYWPAQLHPPPKG